MNMGNDGHPVSAPGARQLLFWGNIILDSLKVTFTDDKILNKVIIRLCGGKIWELIRRYI